MTTQASERIAAGKATMRAMRLERPRPAGERPLTLTEIPMPEPGPGEVLIKVHACGVCHTDLHIVEGELAPHRSPVVPGHEIVGEVVGIGGGGAPEAEVSAPEAGAEAGAPQSPTADGVPIALGTRVGAPWLWRACGTCRFCRRGDENLCENALFTGYDVDGGFAEYTVAPADFVYPLPETDDLAVAPLLCAGIIGYRCLRLTGVVGGAARDGREGSGGGRLVEAGISRAAAGGAVRRLGLYGFGAAAHIAVQIAMHAGWEVFVFTRGAEHRALARELGAVWAGETADAPGGDADLKLDAAIVFAPAGELALAALKALDRGGTVALGGIHSSPVPPIDYPLIYHERVLRSVANSTREDARDLLALAAEIPIVTEVTVFELEQANDALLELKERHVRGAAVLRIG